MTESVFVYLIDFPNTKCRETVTENEDGSYSVFLNARQAGNIQKESCRHAIGHINNYDFEKFNAQEIEKSAHKE